MASSRSSSPSSEDSNDAAKTESNKGANIFRNDGSFLEMFKKMQNASRSNDDNSGKLSSPVRVKEIIDEEPPPAVSKPTSFVGRRRSSKALPVGKVKKLKAEEDGGKPTTTDAWAKYLEEVKKYKETYCDNDSKNRSLVK